MRICRITFISVAIGRLQPLNAINMISPISVRTLNAIEKSNSAVEILRIPNWFCSMKMHALQFPWMEQTKNKSKIFIFPGAVRRQGHWRLWQTSVGHLHQRLVLRDSSSAGLQVLRGLPSAGFPHHRRVPGTNSMKLILPFLMSSYKVWLDFKAWFTTR